MRGNQASVAGEGTELVSKNREEPAQQYEVRLSNTLENVLAEPSDLKRIITVSVRIHSFKGAEA